MINIETMNSDRIIKITDDWCDKNTIGKIKEIMRRLLLFEQDIIDWEIVADDKIYPNKAESNDYGDRYLERDRYITMTVEEEDGSETIMKWDETLELELREHLTFVKLSILFIRK